MRIIIIQRFDLSSVSCARRVLCQTDELLKRGHEVYLTDFVHLERQKEIPATATTINREGAAIVPLDRRVSQWRKNKSTLLQIQPKPDIIHLWKAYPDASLLAIALSRAWDIPLHYDWDDWEKGIAAELTGSSWAGWIAGRWDRLLPSLSDSITVASSFLKLKTLEWGISSERLWDAPVGADVEAFSPRARDMELFHALSLSEPVLCYAGQLEVASYAEYTIDVLAHVRKVFANASLLILGGGRKLQSLRQTAAERNLEKNIIFTDYIPGSEIPRYLSLADIALAPFEQNDVTRAKSPLKIAEYLAMGMPIAASDVGEAHTMIGDAGCCVPCGAVQEMADTIITILNDEDLRKSMSAAGRRIAETRYNWKSHTDNLEAAYQFALRNRKKKST